MQLLFHPDHLTYELGACLKLKSDNAASRLTSTECILTELRGVEDKSWHGLQLQEFQFDISFNKDPSVSPGLDIIEGTH